MEQGGDSSHLYICHQIKQWQKAKNESSSRAPAAWYKARLGLQTPQGQKRTTSIRNFPKARDKKRKEDKAADGRKT